MSIRMGARCSIRPSARRSRWFAGIVDQLEHDLTVDNRRILPPTPGGSSVWSRKMERRPGVALSFPFSRPAKVSPSPPRSKTKRYPIDDLVFDLANIRAGPRFAGEDAPLGGRLGFFASKFTRAPIIPAIWKWECRSHYGSGASEVIRELVENPAAVTE